MSDCLRVQANLRNNKYDAIYFNSAKRTPPSQVHNVIGGVRVEVDWAIMYLGFVLDHRWSFRDHFTLLAPKPLKPAAALTHLYHPPVGGLSRDFVHFSTSGQGHRRQRDVAVVSSSSSQA